MIKKTFKKVRNREKLKLFKEELEVTGIILSTLAFLVISIMSSFFITSVIELILFGVGSEVDVVFFINWCLISLLNLQHFWLFYSLWSQPTGEKFLVYSGSTKQAFSLAIVTLISNVLIVKHSGNTQLAILIVFIIVGLKMTSMLSLPTVHNFYYVNKPLVHNVSRKNIVYLQKHLELPIIIWERLENSIYTFSFFNNEEILRLKQNALENTDLAKARTFVLNKYLELSDTKKTEEIKKFLKEPLDDYATIFFELVKEIENERNIVNEEKENLTEQNISEQYKLLKEQE